LIKLVFLISSAFSEIGYWHAFLVKDAVKAERYNTLSFKMLDYLDQTDDVKALKCTNMVFKWCSIDDINMAKSIAEEFYKIGDPISIIYSNLVYIHEQLRSFFSTPTDYNMQKIELQPIVHKLTEIDILSRNISLRKVKCLEISCLYKAVLSALYFALGDAQQAVTLAAEAAYYLSIQMRYKKLYVAGAQSFFMILPTFVHFATGSKDLLNIDMEIINSVSEKFCISGSLQKLYRKVIFNSDYYPKSQELTESNQIDNSEIIPLKYFLNTKFHEILHTQNKFPKFEPSNISTTTISTSTITNYNILKPQQQVFVTPNIVSSTGDIFNNIGSVNSTTINQYFDYWLQTKL